MQKFCEEVGVTTVDGRIEIFQCQYDGDTYTEKRIRVTPEQIDLLVIWLNEAKESMQLVTKSGK